MTTPTPSLHASIREALDTLRTHVEGACGKNQGREVRTAAPLYRALSDVEAHLLTLVAKAALLPELIDTGDCYYDHHGYCQAHALQPRPCPHARAKASVWRCFHCDDVFTREEDAAAHFGGAQGSLTGCQIKGHEHGLLDHIRQQELELSTWREELHPMMLAMAGMRAEHAEALRREEEVGYARGVRDMAAHAPPEDTTPHESQ